MDTKLNIPHHEKYNIETEYKGEIVGEWFFYLYPEVGIAHVHQEVYRFNPSIYRVLLKQFIEITSQLKELGITTIATLTNNLTDKKLFKYCSLFGSEEPVIIELNGCKYLYTDMEI
jgi:hypothetical protein